jgi:hypothetical protein
MKLSKSTIKKILTLGGIIIEPTGGKNGIEFIIGICGGKDIVIFFIVKIILFAVVIIPIKKVLHKYAHPRIMR